MGGTTLNGDDRQSRNDKKDNFHKPAVVHSDLQNIINRAIRGETTFYNYLLGILQPTLKRDPEYYATLTPAQVETFVKVAKTGYDVRSLINKKSKNVDLPADLEPHRDTLFGIAGDREMGMSERLIVLMEELRRPAAMMPDMKEAMAREMIEYHISQGKSMAQGRIRSIDDEAPAFRNSMETLNQVNTMQKRHIQIQKKFLKMLYDHKNSRTAIYYPFLSSPIYVDGINLLEDMKNWNLMILHQDPGEIILTNAHWECDFRSIPGEYDLKYLEVPNPEAKMKSRHLRRR
jgi:hypothetical protein